MFSFNIEIEAGDGHRIFDVRTGDIINTVVECDNNRFSGGVKLGEHVWAGRSCKIIGGINTTVVGNGSIIGMGAVAKGKFPNNVTIVGNPAKISRRNIAWSKSLLLGDEIKSACSGYCNLTEEEPTP